MIDRKYLMSLAQAGKREDGRGKEEYRAIEVQHNPLSKPEGSALVKIGNTMVIVGVKIDVGEPFPDSPEEGILIVSAEFSPIASPDFESGPPRENSIELARVVDRGIRESKAVEFGKLCITPNEKVWMVFIDIQILNHDGNLIGASALAAAIALANAKMPAYEDGKVDNRKKTKPLPVKFKPIAVNFAKVGGSIFIDPSKNEEGMMDAGMVITVKDDGNISAIQMLGTAGFEQSEIEYMLDKAAEKAEEIRELSKSSRKIMEMP